MLFRIRKLLSKVYTRLLKLILPLTQLTKKGQSFVWTKEADTVFEGLKKAFTSALVLAHVDPQKPFIIEADTHDFALGSILS